MKLKSLVEFKKFIATKRRIVITTHWSPDGDAMGSSLGLYWLFKYMGHQVTVIVPNDYPSFLNSLPGNNKVINSSHDNVKSNNNIKKAELICCLDYNSLKRIDKMGDELKKSNAFKIVIDHHINPENFAQFYYHDVTSSSTSQLVFELIEELGLKSLMHKNIANCLYTGILTDTGSFRFPSTTAYTHRIAAELIEFGANNSEVYNKIYDDNSVDRLRLLGYCLEKKMKLYPELNTGLIYLSEKEQRKFNFVKGDTEGVVNYILSIRGIRFAAFFSEKDNLVKASFRSKGDFDVNKFSRLHFEGGGHKNAAGGISKLTLNKAIEKFCALLPTYKTDLTKK